MGMVIPFRPRLPRRIDWPVAGAWVACAALSLAFWAAVAWAVSGMWL